MLAHAPQSADHLAEQAGRLPDSSKPPAQPESNARRSTSRFTVLDWTCFALLMALLLRKAVLDLDVGWDNLAYHMPFAAMRTGLFAEGEFRYGAFLTGYYDGFPPLADYIKGYLWRVTGQPNAVNLLTVTVLACFCVCLWWLARVPVSITAVALAAIPVIHVQIAGGHPDNLSNLALALG